MDEKKYVEVSNDSTRTPRNDKILWFVEVQLDHTNNLFKTVKEPKIFEFWVYLVNLSVILPEGKLR